MNKTVSGFYLITSDIANKKGHSINIFKTIEGMREAGLDIMLVCPRYRKGVQLEELFDQYVVKKPFPVHQLWIPSSHPSRLSLVLFPFIVTAWLLVRRFRIDYRFVYFRSEHLFLLVMFLRLMRIPYFYELHRIGLKPYIQKIKEHIARNAKGVIVLTDVLRQIFIKCNTTIQVVHDAVDFEHYNINVTKEEARKKLGILTEKPIVMYAGSIQSIKGVEIVLEVAPSFPDVMFYVVGRVKDDMESVFNKLPDNVVLTGAYTQRETPYYLKAADILVLPHIRGPQSQSPMKLFEYMASGRAIICSDLPNLREVLPSDNLFFEPKDTEDLCAKIREYFNQPNKYIAIAASNKEEVKKYTYTKRGKNIVKFIYKNTESGQNEI